MWFVESGTRRQKESFFQQEKEISACTRAMSDIPDIVAIFVFAFTFAALMIVFFK
jgi:hypothetical protein